MKPRGRAAHTLADHVCVCVCVECSSEDREGCCGEFKRMSKSTTVLDSWMRVCVWVGLCSMGK